jgi:hypothetical protein
MNEIIDNITFGILIVGITVIPFVAYFAVKNNWKIADFF